MLSSIDKVIKEKLLHAPKSLITEIHNEIPIKYNSVNVLVGKQGCGKTVAALSEIIKISALGTHHLLIYVTKTGDENDKSWQALKSLLCMPVVVVSEKSVIDVVDEIISAKNLYYLIKREKLENEQEEDQQRDMLDTLHITDFSADQLHTIILFDDISNSSLFSSEESYFSQQLRRCRHTNITYFLLIQGWKGIKPHIKNEITTLMIFPCFNNQQLHYIYSQSASNLSYEEFSSLYKTVRDKKRQYLIVQVTDGGETFIYPAVPL